MTTTLAPTTEAGSPRFEHPLRPLFAVGGLYSKANGVAWIMRDLAAALGRVGSPVTVCAADCAGRESIGDIFGHPTRWVTAEGRWVGGLSWSPKLKPLLRYEVAGADIVHNHSVWMLPNSYASRIAEQLNKPVVITAHGTLEPWALKHSGWKKRLAGLAFQNRDLHRATCIQVNSHAEAAGIRKYGLKQPIAVIPNGVDSVFLDPTPSRLYFDRHFPQVAGRRIVLFMGRLHRKKGLELLVRAWSQLGSDRSDWVLAIAGPDCGFERPVRRMVEELGLSKSVILTGNLQGARRLQALGAAEAFALPSFSEGFSMGILEAMASGLPILLTPQCNFREASTSGAAIEVEPLADSVESGLRQLLSLSVTARHDMGQAGRALITKSYTWDVVARETLRMYRWLARGGPRPDFLLTA